MRRKFYHTLPKQSNTDDPTTASQSGISSAFENIASGRLSDTKSGDYTLTITTPLFKSELEGDVLVPLAQTLVSGILSASVAIPAVMLFGIDWPFGLFIASVGSLVSWKSAVKNAGLSREKTEEISFCQGTEKTSEISHTQSKSVVQLEVIHAENGLKNRMQLIDLPGQIGEADFAEFLRGILSGDSLARVNWVGEGKPFSRDTYDMLIVKLMAAGIICRSEKGGKELTNGGRRAISRVVGENVIASN